MVVAEPGLNAGSSNIRAMRLKEDPKRCAAPAATGEAVRGRGLVTVKITPRRLNATLPPSCGRDSLKSAHDTTCTKKVAIRVFFRATAAIPKIAPWRLSCGTRGVDARDSSADSTVTPVTSPKGEPAKSDAAVVIVDKGPDWALNIEEKNNPFWSSPFRRSRWF